MSMNKRLQLVTKVSLKDSKYWRKFAQKTSTGQESVHGRLSLLTWVWTKDFNLWQDYAWKTLTTDMSMNKRLQLVTGLCMEDFHYWHEQKTSTGDRTMHGRLSLLTQVCTKDFYWWIEDTWKTSSASSWPAWWSHWKILYSGSARCGCSKEVCSPMEICLVLWMKLFHSDASILYHWIAWLSITGLHDFISLDCVNYCHWVAWISITGLQTAICSG